MEFIKSKFKSFAALVAICGVFAFTSSSNEAGIQSGKAWVGISYYLAENGLSNGGAAAVGAIGVLDAVAWGAGVGVVAGGPAGVLAGAVVGL